MNKIQDRFLNIANQKSVTFLHVPSHAGIKLNEKDKEAIDARTANSLETVLCLLDIRKYISKIVHRLRQDAWETKNLKLSQIKEL